MNRMTWLSGLAVGLSMAASTAAAETLKFASLSPEGSIWSQQAIDYMDKVKEAGVDIDFEYFPAGQLGNQPDTLKSMLSGRIDIWVGVMPFLTSITPEVALFTMPYAFDNLDEVKCVVPKMKDATRDLAGDKYKLLQIVPVGVQDIAGTSPVRVPADLSGKKVRVAPLPSTIAYFRSIGATPQPLPGAETASAVQTGLVEAVDLNPAFVVLTGSHKVAKYHIATQHNYNLGAVAISNRTWAKLNDDQKAALMNAADQVDFAQQVDDIAAFEQKLLAKGASEGMETAELTPEERDEWKQAGLAAWDGVLAETPGDIMGFKEKFDAAKASCK